MSETKMTDLYPDDWMPADPDSDPDWLRSHIEGRLREVLGEEAFEELERRGNDQETVLDDRVL